MVAPLIIGTGITVEGGISIGPGGPSAPIAGSFTINHTDGGGGGVANQSTGVAGYITGTYDSLTIVSTVVTGSGTGSATVSGLDILYSANPNVSNPAPTVTITITYYASNGGANSSNGVITVNDKCCVVANAMTETGMWDRSQLYQLNVWGSKVLDQTFMGRAVHKGYHVIAPKVWVPQIQKQTAIGRYFGWTFENGTNMLRGKKYDRRALVSIVPWIAVFTVVGLFTKQETATRSWQNSNKETK